MKPLKDTKFSQLEYPIQISATIGTQYISSFLFLFFSSVPVPDVVAIFINNQEGRRLAELADNGVAVRMSISQGSQQSGGATRVGTGISKTAVVFVSVFLILNRP